MTCPHCGEEMLAEQVFCEKCGKERLLVPVYEPEIEESVAESMNGIIDELGGTISQNNQTENEKQNTEINISEENNTLIDIHEKDHHAMKQLRFLAISVISLIVLVSVFSIIFFFYTDNSYEYHYNKAIEAFEAHQFDEALYQTDYCLNENPDDFELHILKFHIFLMENDNVKALELAKIIVTYDPLNEEALELIVSNYINNEEYLKLSKYLELCESDDIKQKYADYLASFPEYSEPEGEYDTAISLKLFSVGKGDIYYTLDGTTPSKYTDRYTNPIKLVSGEYLVSAIYINEYGISSEVVIKKYDINSNIADVPTVSVESGSYSVPQIISVEAPSDEYIIYYTTDGSEPDLDSNIYTNAFPMPLGNSTFKFLMVDADGNESDIVTYKYSCNINSNYTIEQAIFILKQHLSDRGELLNVDGSLAPKEYVVDSAVAKDNVVYYLIYEYANNGNGFLIKTGNIFAFSVSDASLYRATISSDGLLSLTDF